jgi:large conductance mechanosensitive channel
MRFPAPNVTGMSPMLKEFREFILRGNLVDLAIAVVIGTAFGAVITALVADILTPLIAAFGGQPDFSALKFEVNGSTFRYGHFLNALLAFVMVSAVVFFLVLKPVNALMSRRKVDTPTDARTRSCPECLSDIPVAARRCAFCTTDVGPPLNAA